LRTYELCLILQPEVSDEDTDNLINSLKEIISKHKGSILKIEKCGKKILKYSIKKRTKGVYCFLNYEGNNEILQEIERNIKFNESVLRYSTVRSDMSLTTEDIKTEPTIKSETAEEPAENNSVDDEENNPMKPALENADASDT
jgi:small subunit ribosomal protein S6